MAYRWESAHAWLREKIANAQEEQLLAYLNPLVFELQTEVLEEMYAKEMASSGYFDHPDRSAQEWFLAYAHSLSGNARRQAVMRSASSLDSGIVQDIFRSELEADDYFESVGASAGMSMP